MSESRVLIKVVLGEASVLYSRVLREYLIYAMANGLIRVMWSARILSEVSEHLNIATFDDTAGQRWASDMNDIFPYSETEVTDEARKAVAEFGVEDESDRHIIETAIAADASLLFSYERAGFPSNMLDELGIELLTVDQLLSRLMLEDPEVMTKVHRDVVMGVRSATGESTLAALRRSGAQRAADLLEVCDCTYPTSPRALCDPALREYRFEQALRDHSVAELNNLVLLISRDAGCEGELAYLDPTYGGVDAEVILLLKAPQADADRRRGRRRLISLDNDDEVAATLFELLNELGVDRKRLVAWNICPFPIKNFDPSGVEFEKGKEEFRRFTELLRHPKKVVVMGSATGKGWREHSFDGVAPGLDPIFAPSPSGIDGRPRARQELRDALACAFGISVPPT